MPIHAEVWGLRCIVDSSTSSQQNGTYLCRKLSVAISP